VRAKVQIVTLDASGPFFANFVLFRGKKLFIGLPVIRVVTALPTAFQLFKQTLVSGIRAAAAWRKVLSTVFGLKRKTREISRLPEPFIVIGTIMARTAPTQLRYV
jgi:hypothetical protein